MDKDEKKGQPEGGDGGKAGGSAKQVEKQAESVVKPSSPGETGTTPGTNWK